MYYYRVCKRSVKDCESRGLWYDGDMLEMGLYSAIAPLILLLLSSVWTYPAVLEEVVKWGILKLGDSGKVLGVREGAVVGLVFGLSEAVLFAGNAWGSGAWSSIGMRLLLTVPMHTLTAIIIAWGIKNKMGLVGLLGAMVIHGVFNYLVSLTL